MSAHFLRRSCSEDRGMDIANNQLQKSLTRWRKHWQRLFMHAVYESRLKCKVFRN